MVTPCAASIGVPRWMVAASVGTFQSIHLQNKTLLSIRMWRVQKTAVSDMREKRKRRWILQELQNPSVSFLWKRSAFFDQRFMASCNSPHAHLSSVPYCGNIFNMAPDECLPYVRAYVCPALRKMWRNNIHRKVRYVTLNTQ